MIKQIWKPFFDKEANNAYKEYFNNFERICVKSFIGFCLVIATALSIVFYPILRYCLKSS